MQLRHIMSDFDIGNIQDLDQVEITDLDGQFAGFGDALSIRALRVVRRLPFMNDPRGRFIPLMYGMCAVVLLFMVQPGLPAMTEPLATQAHELQYPVAIYPFTVQDTSPSQHVTWIRTSNGRIITLQSATGRIAWHHCKVQHWFAPPKYTHTLILVCT